jgi:hypothetical protein
MVSSPSAIKMNELPQIRHSDMNSSHFIGNTIERQMSDFNYEAIYHTAHFSIFVAYL